VLSYAQFPSNYKPQADLLIATATQNIDFQNFEYLCDTFGPRYRGTPGLDNALEWIVQTMRDQGLENVMREPVVNITNWIRGKENLQLLKPRYANLALLGLGRSVGGTVLAPAVVVASFDELKALGSKAKGTIVVYNCPFVSYDQTVEYRTRGASEAAKVGAVAALVRTIGSFSLYTPHTGEMSYEDGVPQIPTACITIEDAEMLARMYARNQSILLSLEMGATTGPTVTSYNIIAEIQGRDTPEEVVVLGGHSDSWDVGQGAIDDGGGLFTSWESLKIIHDLVESGKLQRPRRTIRVVLWVDEEISQRGAATYLQDHLSSLQDHVIAFESDSGNFQPVGFGFTGVPAAKVIMQQIGTLLASIGAGNITDGGADTDNGPLVQAGVPGGVLNSSGFDDSEAYYFWFHHSNADMITHINKQGFVNSVAAFAVMSYILADMEERLPNK
jgi:carboxypeptidase Q